ncbi:MAG TPA: tRNA pseudouridine(38-40) synthase TruA [Actinomycetes bacterium]|nr:tRNA pseudouridine(38-40) synthase TruA [Actinomycetes bacterium]
MTRADEPAAPGAGGGGLIRLRLDLAYDGTGFAGWARQPGEVRTVQRVVEDGLATVLRIRPERVALVVGGRTDAGVHARGQVAHADVPVTAWRARAAVAARRLSGLLPPDVLVRSVEPAVAGFDARFSALSRRYAYRVNDDPAGPDPLRRLDVLWYKREVDVKAMNEAAADLVGEHDFAAYCRRRVGASTVRRLISLSWVREQDGLAVAQVVADGFCHNMVRSLVGALLAVGDGSRLVGWPAAVLATGVREPGVQVVAPHGLTLEEIRYPADPAELTARALETRQHRS